MRKNVNALQKRLHLAIDEGRRFTFSTRKLLGFDLAGRIPGEDAFFGQPGEEHPDCGQADVSAEYKAMRTFPIDERASC